MTTVELVFHMLALGDVRAWGQQGQFLGHEFAMQIGCSDFVEHHTQLAAEKTCERNFQLRVGEEKDFFAFQMQLLARQCSLGALAWGASDGFELGAGHSPSCGGGLQPSRSAFGTQREGRGESLCAT